MKDPYIEYLKREIRETRKDMSALWFFGFAALSLLMAALSL